MYEGVIVKYSATFERIGPGPFEREWRGKIASAGDIKVTIAPDGPGDGLPGEDLLDFIEQAIEADADGYERFDGAVCGDLP